MKQIVAILTIALLASSALAVTNWGVTPHTGGTRTRANLNDYVLTVPETATAATMRFTAQSNMAVNSVAVMGGQKGSPSPDPTGAIIELMTDVGGLPGVSLGTTGVLPYTKQVANKGALGNTVNLVAGTIYHLKVTANNVATGNTNGISVKCMDLGQDLNLLEIDGETVDPTLEFLYYDSISTTWRSGIPTQDPLAPGATVADIAYGLYGDVDGLVAVGGNGYDSTATAYLKTTNSMQGESFIVQNLPAGTINKVDTLSVYMTKKNSPAGLITVSVRDAADNILASGTIDAATATTGWQEVSIPLTTLTVGQRYSIIADASGMTDVGGTRNLSAVAHTFVGAVPKEFSFQGTGAYLRSTLDGGTTWTMDDSQDLMIGMNFVPEPATMGLLLIGGLGILARRRRR